MIPVFDVSPVEKLLHTEFLAATERVLKSGTYILGKEGEAFEQEVSAFFDNSVTAVGCASGSDALELAMRAYDLSPEDEVIVPGNSYPTVWGVLRSRVRVVPCDVDLRTGALSIEDLRQAITSRTRAVVVVHLFGQCMLSTELEQEIRQRDLVLIEDCAQSFGASREGKLLGSLGDIAVTSFYPTKPLGAYGDGGMVLTAQQKIAQKLRALRMYGEVQRYESQYPGVNSRLDELQAAFLRVKLPHVMAWQTARQALVRQYKEGLQHIPELLFFDSPWSTESACHLLPIVTSRRDELQKFLSAQNIATGIHYPRSLSQVPSIASQITARLLPNAEVLTQKVLSLPLYNGLTEDQMALVIESIGNFYAA